VTEESATPSERSRWIGVAAITALSLVVHLWRLGARPLAHDEAIDAWFSWQARGWGVMRYDPVYHGPLRFYLEGPVLRWLDDGAFGARLVAALAGTATTALIAASTRTLGRVGALAAAVLFVVSPTALTVTRTGREDSLVGLVSVALLLLVARLLVAPRPVHAIGGGALLAVSFGLKETTFLFSLAAVVFLAGLAIVAAARPDGASRAALRRIVGLGRIPWMWAVIAFFAVFAIVYTSGFRYTEGFESGLLDGVRYWWGQHDVRRGGQPWFFYLVIYAAYEWLTIGLAAAGVAVTVRRRSPIGAWFTAMLASQLVLYTWAGEKFAWLALHPLLPAVLLAGLGAEALWRRIADAPRWRAPAAATAFALVALSFFVASRPAITHGADPRELLVTVQASDDVPAIVTRLTDGVRDGEISTIVIDDKGGVSWPWAWYLHDVPGVSYQQIDPADLPEADAVIVWAPDEQPVIPRGYQAEEFPARVWWVPDYGGASVGDLLRWAFTRQTWNETGSLRQLLITRER